MREEIQERGNPRYGKRNSDSISENQITNFKSKPEVMKNYPQSIETVYEEPIEENNLNLCEKTGMNFNQNNKVSERKLQTIVEQQPNELINNMNPRSNHENIQNSYERTVEARAAQSPERFVSRTNIGEEKIRGSADKGNYKQRLFSKS